jgi:hypothetical protein
MSNFAHKFEMAGFIAGSPPLCMSRTLSIDGRPASPQEYELHLERVCAGSKDNWFIYPSQFWRRVSRIDLDTECGTLQIHAIETTSDAGYTKADSSAVARFETSGFMTFSRCHQSLTILEGIRHNCHTQLIVILGKKIMCKTFQPLPKRPTDPETAL